MLQEVDELKQLIKDMAGNLYALYHRHNCMCHGDPQEGYEFLPELLGRIEKVLNEKEEKTIRPAQHSNAV